MAVCSSEMFSYDCTGGAAACLLCACNLVLWLGKIGLDAALLLARRGRCRHTIMVIKFACGRVPRSAPLKLDLYPLLCGSVGPPTVLSYQQRPSCLPSPPLLHRLRAGR